MRKTIFFVLLSYFACAQNKKIDSLRQLEKSKKNFNVLNELGWEFIRIDIDSVFHYNQKSKKYISNVEQEAEYENLLGKYFLIKGDYLTAEKQANKTIAISKVSNNVKMLSSAYNTLLSTANRTGNLLLAKKYAEKNLHFSILSADQKKILNAYLNLGSVCLDLNDTEATKKNYLQAKKYFDDSNIYEQAVITKNLGLSYNKAGDFTNSIKFLKESEKLLEKASVTRSLASLYNILANNFRESNQFALAKDYLDKSIKIAKNEKDSSDVFYEYSNLMLATKNYKKAKEFLAYSMKTDIKNDNQKKIAENYFLFAEIERFSNNPLEAEKNYKKAIALSEKVKDSIILAQSIRSLLLNKLSTDKYYQNHLDKYTSLLNKNFHKEKLKSIVELDVAYETDKKNEKIKIQEKTIFTEKKNKINAYLSLGILGTLSFSGFLFLRNRQKNKELQNQNNLLSLQQSLNEMELQNLNKQLDPHEIKNLLASISPEIQEKAPDSYKKMLKLFNITKASLNNNSLTDSIENQTQQIEDFLSLEKSMLPKFFEYSIKNEIKNKDLQIPRLMLKNLVENAIKHGIKRSENGGKIEVLLFEKNNVITISVDDTGKGRQQNVIPDSGIGLSTYQKLFTSLNQKNKDIAIFQIFDKEQGTRVEVKIPQNYKYN